MRLGTLLLGAALRLGAHLAPGPRDGLVVAVHRRTGWPVGAARAVLDRAVLERAVPVAAVLLGGPVGLRTVRSASGTGPALQLALRALQQSPVRLATAVPA